MPRYQYLLAAIAVPFGILAFIFALVRNPGMVDMNSKFGMMKNDMDALLGEGGSVLRSDGNIKYGNAVLVRIISDEGWSTALLRNYQKTLEVRGWKRIEDDEIFYCKNGIQATLKPNDGVLDGKGVNYIGMTYNALTIKRCGKA
jgi:hypothetical protein